MVNISKPASEKELKYYTDWLFLNSINYKILESSDAVNGTLLLTGGSDIGKNKSRDDLEFNYIKQALNGNFKILGVCRGMQILNVYFGGIVENLDVDALKSHNVHTINNIDCVDAANQIDINISNLHQIKDLSNSKLITVNSRHHQYCSKLADILIPTYISNLNKNIIEGFKPFNNQIVGVQWHPERCESLISISEIELNEFLIDFLKNDNVNKPLKI